MFYFASMLHHILRHTPPCLHLPIYLSTNVYFPLNCDHLILVFQYLLSHISSSPQCSFIYHTSVPPSLSPSLLPSLPPSLPLSPHPFLPPSLFSPLSLPIPPSLHPYWHFRSSTEEKSSYRYEWQVPNTINNTTTKIAYYNTLRYYTIYYTALHHKNCILVLCMVIQYDVKFHLLKNS